MILALNFSLADIGIIGVTLPASLIVFLGREWFITGFLRKVSVAEDVSSYPILKNILISFDLWAFTLLCFWGVSWGGLLNGKKKNSLLTFIFGQLWYILVILVSVVFLHTKNLGSTDYMYILFIQIIKFCWICHLVNYIPIPPFDLSFLYSETKLSKKYIIISKIIVSVLIVLFPVHNSFITGESFLNWVGIL